MAEVRQEEEYVPKKSVDAPPPEGLPEWLATFADMMSLLLCFFVLLLSFANQDVVKFRDLMGSIQDAFGVQVKRVQDPFIAYSPTMVERKGMELKQDDKELLGLVLSLRSEMDAQASSMNKMASVSSERGGVMLRVESKALFDPGSATLKPDAKQVMDSVIKILKERNFDLVVQGHTDDGRDRSSQFPSNWELSASRAAAALRYITEVGGVPSKRLTAVGFADTRPLVPNTSEESRAINRRVEFMFRHPEAKALF